MRYIARVIPGRGEGRKLGFPTLNLEIPENFTAKQGIYAGWVWFGDDSPEKMPAAVHYGPVPAFGSEQVSLEAHIIDKDIPLPPKAVSLEMVKYIRKIEDFKDLQALRTRIREDIRQVREVLEIV